MFRRSALSHWFTVFKSGLKKPSSPYFNLFLPITNHSFSLTHTYNFFCTWRVHFNLAYRLSSLSLNSNSKKETKDFPGLTFIMKYGIYVSFLYLFFQIKISYLVFGSPKMIKKRIHLTIGIITLGIHGNECSSSELLSGIIKEWGDAWASVATARMPAGGSLTHSLATSRTSRRGIFCRRPERLYFWAFRALEDGMLEVRRRIALDSLSCWMIVRCVWLSSKEWLIDY